MSNVIKIGASLFGLMCGVAVVKFGVWQFGKEMDRIMEEHEKTMNIIRTNVE